MTADDAIAHLDRLRGMILAGDLSGLEDAADLLHGIEAVARSGSWDRAGLERVRQAAARSGDMLRAGVQGVRSARRRLNEISAAQGQAGTYGADGKRPSAIAAPTRDARA